jgi:4-hydroxybenzoyl-CoA thioesterase
MHETNGIPTVDLKIQFKNAARLGENLTKKLWVKELKNSSIICGFEFENESNNLILEGEVTLVNVAFNAERNGIKAEPISEEMKEEIKKYLNS